MMLETDHSIRSDETKRNCFRGLVKDIDRSSITRGVYSKRKVFSFNRNDLILIITII